MRRGPALARALTLSLALLWSCGACVAAATGAVMHVDGRAWRLDVQDARASIVVSDGVESRTFEATSLDGRRRGRVVAVAVAPSRRSFLVALDTLPELWEVSVDPKAAPVYDGLVHDWRMGESLPQPGFLHPRRTPLPHELRALAPQAVGPWLLALSGEGTSACSVLVWVHLDARTVVQTVRLPGMVELATARVDASVAAHDGLELRVVPPDGSTAGAMAWRRIAVPVARDGRRALAVDECSTGGKGAAVPARATQPTR